MQLLLFPIFLIYANNDGYLCGNPSIFLRDLIHRVLGVVLAVLSILNARITWNLQTYFKDLRLLAER